MFLSNYVNDVYYNIIIEEYDYNYLLSLDENNFCKIYYLFLYYGFNYVEDIILKYLEIFDMEINDVKEKIEELKDELGNNFTYIIGNNLSLLERILE